MFKVVYKKKINPQSTFMTVEAPSIAKKALPGQYALKKSAKKKQLAEEAAAAEKKEEDE